MRNGVQLITYAERFGRGDLGALSFHLDSDLEGLFTGVHILPFFTPFDGADAGFDPTDHTEVDPRLGDWDAVAEIARTYDVTADLIVNHVSDQSPQFKDFLALGDDSAYAGMFLEVESVFPGGASPQELAAIYRPRPGLPFTTVATSDGIERAMWATFTRHQIDLDVDNPQARDYLLAILDRFAAAGVVQVRLDAVGYAIKTRGTSCFLTPETYRFIHGFCAEVRARGMASLLEVHAHYSHQVRLARTVDRVYDFALPPLVLHTLHTGSTVALRKWLEISPRNCVTVLDTHDGIGVVDVGRQGDLPGLLSDNDLDSLVEQIHQASNGQSRLATGGPATNLDVYQVNCSYYSALGSDDNLYLLARLIQFLSPGIPQVYYGGLFAAPNDMTLLAQTGSGRDINRPYIPAIATVLNRPVVQRLLALIRWRNAHRAFAGDFAVSGTESQLRLTWTAADAALEVTIDGAAATFTVECTDGDHACTIDNWESF